MSTSVEARRRVNEGRCERLVARSGLVDSHGIAWDMAPSIELDDDAVACLAYMRDVEGVTDRYVVGLAGHPATVADPLLSRFLDAWRTEEAEHARVLDRFLHAYAGRGQVLPPPQPPPPAVASLTERALVTATRPIGHVVTAMHMVWGAINELSTMTGYRLLARRSGHPVLAQLLGWVTAQEARHYSFYMLQAEWRLAASRLARAVVPTLVRQAWTPVGVGHAYEQRSEFDRVLRYLAAVGREVEASPTCDEPSGPAS